MILILSLFTEENMQLSVGKAQPDFRKYQQKIGKQRRMIKNQKTFEANLNGLHLSRNF